MIWRVWLLSLVLFFFKDANAWGFFAHRFINKQACYNIPIPLYSFYNQHINYIETHATDPDNRRGFLEGEACRHFLDGDYYERVSPFDTLPKRWVDAVAKYSQDTLLKHGIVPWHCQRMLQWLVKAFSEKNTERILQLSAELGHYIADANVPLHTTSNYNGQLTGQHGVHAFWESRIPEKSASSFPIFVSEAEFIPNFKDSIWVAIEHSYSLVKNVLDGEMKIRKTFPEESKFGYFLKNGKPLKRESNLYIEAFQQTLGTMVSDQMKHSIFLISSAWYTAWILAGEPDMNFAKFNFIQRDNFPIDSLIFDSLILDHSH